MTSEKRKQIENLATENANKNYSAGTEDWFHYYYGFIAGYQQEIVSRPTILEKIKIFIRSLNNRFRNWYKVKITKEWPF